MKGFSKKEVNKRGQVAIFIIVALVIVSVILVIFLYPRISPIISGGELNPQTYLSECIQPEIDSSVSLLAKQGGYANPDGFIVYKNQKLKYLCYTSEFYKPCVVQQPMLKPHFESELNSLLAPKAAQCIKNLQAEYEQRGYTVSISKTESKTEIIPGKIRVNFITPMTITKETSNSFTGFNIEINSGMYELLAIASSIVDFESTLGDSETTLYLQYYPNLKIEKTKLSEGSKIYILSDVISGESFTFASRSLAWPAGYGLE